MVVNPFLQYQDMSLQSLAQKLNESYYGLINVIVTYSNNYFEQIKNTYHHETYPPHLLQYSTLLAGTKKYIDNRTRMFLPYVEELVQKDTERHNCANCTGNCEVQHAANLISFKESLKDIKAIETEIRNTVSEQANEHSNEFEPLYNKMTLLQVLLSEIVYIEEHILLPKIKSTQKNINVAS